MLLEGLLQIPADLSQFPGNLRQLDNVIRRAWALAQLDVDERPAPEGEVVVLRREHVELALEMERPASAGAGADLLDTLAYAAGEVVAHSVAQTPGARVELDTIVSSFRARVLLGAVERCPTVEAAGSSRSPSVRPWHAVQRVPDATTPRGHEGPVRRSAQRWAARPSAIT